VCQWFALLVQQQQPPAGALQQPSAVWLNASASIVGPGSSQLLLSAGPVQQGSVVLATRYGWAAWPVIMFVNSHGLPMVPWNASL
jgi:hypothetical protein